MSWSIRNAYESEIDRLIKIEDQNDQVFAEYGLRFDNVTLYGRDVYERACDLEKILVVPSNDDEPIAYAVLEEVDGDSYLAEIDVVLGEQSKGIGTFLLNEVVRRESEAGYTSIWLTTFADLPFNKPWYEKYGFEVVEPDKYGPDMKAKWQHEIDAGLHVAPRVIMRRHL